LRGNLARRRLRILAQRTTSAQQRLLKGQLKFAQRAERAGKDTLQMLGRLQEGIGLEAVRSFLPATQASPHSIQALEHMINRFQGKGQSCRLRRGLKWRRSA